MAMRRRTHRHPAPLAAALLLALPLLASGLACRSTTTGRPNRIARHHPPRVEAVDAEHYALELWLLPDERAIRGRCELRFAVSWGTVEELVLDLEGLDVLEVSTAEGVPLDFDHDAGRLEIELPTPLREGDLGEVHVLYAGQPSKGLWFVEEPGGGAHQVFTQGECVDAHWWFPCLDYPADRATSELRVHMPPDWRAVAAGQRIDLVETPHERVEHWRMNTPHPTYLTTLCAGNFLVKRDEWDGIPLTYLADPRFDAWMVDSFEETPRILEFFSELTGRRYPYPKYAQTCVGNFPFGGMENISATTLTESTLTDELGQLDGGSTGLVAHEAAHQWFGDLLTCEDWSEIWLNEGFATYLTHLYFEETRGVDAFRVRMRDAQQSYTAADVGGQRRPTVHDYYRDPFDLFFDGKAYAGGASRLHLLRCVLGDEAFFRGLRLYVADNAGRSVRTPDLRAAMETVSGRDLRRFFEQWFYKAGYPELEVSWNWDDALHQVELVVEQIQSSARDTPTTFEFEVEVELRNGAGRRVERLLVDEREERFLLPSATRPIWVRFDKHGWLPARVLATKSGSEWIAIAAEDDDVNGRRDAVDALGRLLATEEDPEKAAVYGAAILRRLRDDPAESVRREAVEAFARAPRGQSRGFLMRAAGGDESAGVRAAALAALEVYGPDGELADFAEEQAAEGISWKVRLAAASLRAKAAPGGAFDWLLEGTGRSSPHDVFGAGCVAELAELEDSRVTVVLREVLADEARSSAARQAAATGLGLRGRAERESMELLLEALASRDYRVRQSAIEALAGFRDARVVTRLREEHERSVHSRERRKLEETLSALGASLR